MAKYWYSYSSTATSPQTSTSIVTLANYILVGTTRPSCPGASKKICAVYATGTNSPGSIPISFGTHTVGYITTAFNAGTGQPSLAGAYAYVKA